MQRTGAVETLRRYKANGYKYLYFEIASYSLNPGVCAVDFVYPWDDYCTIDDAIANTDLLRGRMLSAA